MPGATHKSYCFTWTIINGFLSGDQGSHFTTDNCETFFLLPVNMNRRTCLWFDKTLSYYFVTIRFFYPVYKDQLLSKFIFNRMWVLIHNGRFGQFKNKETREDKNLCKAKSACYTTHTLFIKITGCD